MKTYIKYLISAIFITLTLWSCDDDFLDKQPLDAISKSTFWKTEDDVKMALASCYGRLNDIYTGQSTWGPGIMHFDGLTDNGYTQYPWEGRFNIVATGAMESTSPGVVTDLWLNCYRGIATCNIFLNNIDAVETLDDAKRNKYKGEVLFIRSFWYNLLTQFYGDCPLILTAITEEESKEIQRTSKDVIVTQILNDLNEAIGYLPDLPYQGQVVKASAQALKARVCLYNKMWSEAAQAAKAVMDNPNFELSPNYRDIFSGPGQNNNKEILFSVRYLKPNIYHGLNFIHSWWSSITPLASFVDTYEKLPDWDPEKPYEKRDPRLHLSYYFPGDPFTPMPGGIYNTQNSSTKTGWDLSKFTDVPIWSSRGVQNDQDIVHLRLADVNLMYAEAMFMDGKGNDASALAAVNEVRGRFGNMLPSLTTLTEEAIRYERRVELAFEFSRIFDIKRWRIAHIVMNNLPDAVASGYHFEDPKHYLWPIPQSEIDIMGPDFGQNPGY